MSDYGRAGIYYKIGISHDPPDRRKKISTSSPEPVRLLFAVRCLSEQMAKEFEKQLHHLLKGYVSNGEWFKAEKEKIAVAVFDLMVDVSRGDVPIVGKPVLVLR